MNTCNTPALGNRRTFWTWQDCKVFTDACGNDCTDWGLKLLCVPNTNGLCDPYNHKVGEQRTIQTNDWLRSLIISILGTDARRPATECGYRPGARGGHWSDSYRNGRYAGTVGTSVRYLSPQGRIADAVLELKAVAEYDLQKLVTYGVATAVAVEATYIGNNMVNLVVNVSGQGSDTKTRIGLNVTRIANAWVWDT